VAGPVLTGAGAEVTITYDAPTADQSTHTISFGTQPQGTASAARILTLTNNGSAPLVVSGVRLAGANADDYFVGDGCQEQVAVGSSCQIGVRFDPQAPGASSATMSVLTNATTAPAVSLSGTGGSLPQGPAGATGPAGPAGATGAPGPAGKVELIMCKTVVKTVHGHRHKAQKCTGRLVSGTVKFTTSGKLVHATLSRRGRVYALGESVPAAGGDQLLVLNDIRRPGRGSHTLALRSRQGRRWITHRIQITLS
jgi:uncharacterized protein DUF1573